MAKNKVLFGEGHKRAVVCSDPTTPASGGPVRLGYETGVALNDEDTTSGLTSVDFGPGVWDLSVKGVNDSGNSAVAAGDLLFYVDADTPKLSKKSSGYFFGIALETVGSGLTDTINVKHLPAPGTGAIAAGGVGATQLANSGVTAAKLAGALKIGTVPLPLENVRIVASNDVGVVNATDGGQVAKDTAPIFERVNGATDKALRLRWAASSVVEVILGQFVYPADLDDTAVVEVHLLARYGGATNSTALIVSYFEGIGDTNAGGNTVGTLSATLAEVVTTIAAVDVGAAPNVATIGLTPPAHGTDDLQVYAAWIEYTRKDN